MKSELYILTIFVSLISCDSKVSEKKSLITQDSSKNTITIDEEQIGVVYSSEVVKVWADTLIDAEKISNISLKFEPYIYFEDFKIEQIYNGTKAQIDYNSNKIAREFRTVITSEYSKSRVNFGGHYCFITWDCGAPCIASALVDLIDGKVYEGLTTPLGMDFREDSRMLIANPPDETGFYDDCNYCHPEIWIWDENTKKFNEMQPKTK